MINKVFVKMDDKDWVSDSIIIPASDNTKKDVTVKLAVCTNVKTARKVVKEYASVFSTNNNIVVGKMVFNNDSKPSEEVTS